MELQRLRETLGDSQKKSTKRKGSMSIRRNSIAPLVFISHAADADKKLAIAIKDWIVQEYNLKNENVFASSSARSINGKDFNVSQIGKMLKRADVVLVILSKEAMQKPWLTFEAGAGFSREKLISPLLCRGAMVEDIPERSPLRLLQARSVNDKESFDAFIDDLDKELVCGTMKHNSERLDNLRETLRKKSHCGKSHRNRRKVYNQ